MNRRQRRARRGGTISQTMLALGAAAVLAAAPAAASSGPPLGGERSPSYGGGGLHRHGPVVRLTLLAPKTLSAIVAQCRLRVRLGVSQGSAVRVTATLLPAGRRRSLQEPQALILEMLRSGKRDVAIRLPSGLCRELGSQGQASLTVRALAENSSGRFGRATLHRSVSG